MHHGNETEPLLLKETEAAKLLGVSVSYLQKRRFYREPGPPFLRIGARSVRYPMQALREWVAARVEGNR